MLYIQEQYRSGRELGKSESGKNAVIENGKLLREEFLNLSAADKKVCSIYFSRLISALFVSVSVSISVCCG